MSLHKYSETTPGGRPAIKYYKYGTWMPELWVEEKWRWSSYNTNGTRSAGRIGRIPKGVRARLREIDEIEAKQWIPAVFREPTTPPPSVAAREPSEILREGGFVEFKPNRWRYCGVTVFALLPLAAVSVAIGFLAGPWKSRLLLSLVAFPIVAYSLGRGSRFMSDFEILVTDGAVHGPGGQRRRPTEWNTIPLHLLDRRRSAKRRLIDRLLGRQYLYAMRDTRIYLQRWSFAPKDLHRLLAALGMQDDTRRSARLR